MQILVKAGKFGQRAFPMDDNVIADMVAKGMAKKFGKIYVEVKGDEPDVSQTYHTKVMVAEEPKKRGRKPKAE